MSRLERLILRALVRPKTQSDVLDGIPTPDERGGGFSDQEVIAALRGLMDRGLVSVVKTGRRRNDEV